LQSGDTSAAQKLLAQLQQDLQASGQNNGAHHHHYHHGGFSSANANSAYMTNMSVGSPGSTSTGTDGGKSGSGISANA
jgi:hypothetical protein